MRISDWSSDVCSSDLVAHPQSAMIGDADDVAGKGLVRQFAALREEEDRAVNGNRLAGLHLGQLHAAPEPARTQPHEGRSEEHTYELQSLMRISYAVF